MATPYKSPISRSNSVDSKDRLNDEICSYNSFDEETPKEPWYKKVLSLSLTEYANDEERMFVRRLDFFLLSWGCLSYCIKNIDSSNYKNAYVSGMKEDLNMNGNEYNLLSTFFSVGYAAAAIPCQIVMSKVKASYYLASCELLWGICTGLCAIPQNSAVGLYPLRFLIGVFESSSWSGMMVVLFNYYTPCELAFRAGLISASAFVGQIVTSFMQAAIYRSMNDYAGISGWRWLFIINAIITVCVAVFGYYFIPDTPANGGARWMKESEVAVALKRVIALGRVTERRFKIREFFKAFLDSRIYFILLAYMPWDLGLNATSYITLWLKSLKNPDGSEMYSVEQVNLIPIIGFTIGVVTIVSFTKFVDLTGKKIHALVFQQVCGIVGCTILSIWPKSLGLKYAGFFILYTVQSTGAIVMSFVPEVWADAPERRAVITAIIVILDFSINSWLPLLIWPATEAPEYKYGYKVSLGFQILSLFGSILFYFYTYKRAVSVRALSHSA